MPRESGYFEEAYRLCRDPDPFVSRTAEGLYQSMLAAYSANGRKPSPSEEFNILYFFQSVIRALLLEHPDIKLTSTKFPYSCACVHAMNWPDEAGRSSDTNALSKRYLKLVKGDSNPSSDNFDVSYALEIIQSTFDEAGELKHSIASTEDYLVDDDYWLSGFNSHQA